MPSSLLLLEAHILDIDFFVELNIFIIAITRTILWWYDVPSIKCKESRLKIFIELSTEQASKFNTYEGVEETDEFRLKVMEKEQKIVQQLKKEADFFIDFDSADQIYHL